MSSGPGASTITFANWFFSYSPRSRPRRAPLHVVVVLSRHELVHPACLCDLEPVSPRARPTPERIGIEAGLRERRPRAAVPRERRRVVRWPGGIPRCLDRAPAAESRTTPRWRSEARRRRRREKDSIVRSARDRLGRSQPGVVREPPVVDRRSERKTIIPPLAWLPFVGQGLPPPAPGRAPRILRLGGRAGDDAAWGAAPPGLEISESPSRIPRSRRRSVRADRHAPRPRAGLSP